MSAVLLSSYLVLPQANENEADKVLFEDRAQETFMVCMNVLLARLSLGTKLVMY